MHDIIRVCLYPRAIDGTMIRFREKFLLKFKNEGYAIQQKAFILFIFSLILLPILIIPIVVNIAIPVSSQPIAINSFNGITLIGVLVSLLILWHGRYTAAVTIIIIVMTIRLTGGILIKIEDLALAGSNNNVYFIFIGLVITALFGSRRLLFIISFFFAMMNIILIPVIARYYPSANMNQLYGSTINVIIAIVSVSYLSHLITSITEKMFIQNARDLETNRGLTQNLSNKVQELEAMYEEMESMNEELGQTYGELLEANKDLGIFKKFVEESGQGLCLVNMDGTIIYGNPSILKILGILDKQTIIGTKTRNYYSDEIWTTIRTEIMPRVRAEGQWSGELPIRNVRGEIITALQNIFFIRDDNGSPVHVATVATDISEMKRIEEKLMRAHKMEAIGRLSGGIAHDYNNILTAILGFSQILQKQIPPEDPRAELVEEIIKAGNISAGITRQLLAFSRNQFLKPEVIDLNDSIKKLEKMLRRFTGESIDLSIRLNPGIRSIYADPAQIDQVVLNLVINACDAMPASGTLIIETGNTDVDGPAPDSILEGRTGPQAYISIEDTGIGMDKAGRDHMFEPFFSTKSAASSTGLGLSVVYGIVKQHGGWINVYSEPGRGTRVKVFIPASSMETAAASSALKTNRKFAGNGERILLVEDHLNVRSFAARTLREYGYMVVEAEHAIEALSRFNRDGGNYNLLFSDVVLPGKNGFLLAEELAGLNPRIKVLLTSGYTGARSQIDTIMEKRYPFLQKPYSMNDLLESVYSTLHGSS